MATALASLMSLPIVPLAPEPSPIQPLTRLAAALGLGSPRLLIKRDDLLSFAMGGNKVRKLEAIAAEARARGADTIVTCGGLQSNHARATAAAGAALGFRVVLVLNGAPPAGATGNLRLDRLFGAEIRHVASREDREPAMAAAAEACRAAGGTPFVVPVGASTPTGALGFARAIAEIAAAGVKPDVIVHASSSGGTQAGLVAGVALFGLRARVIGISADETAPALQTVVTDLLRRMAAQLGASSRTIGADVTPEVDDRHVGPGYGIATPESIEATELVARREGIVLDPVYTAKAMSGLLAGIRAGEFGANQTVLFWHTGGIPGYFA
jgi:D-cysteine desulfhydrase family pyridoxal phosphate-dependent enzyme